MPSEAWLARSAIAALWARSAWRSGLPGGRLVPTSWASPGDDDAPGQAGEEQGGGQAVGGELVVAAVRDAFDDLVGAEPAHR